MPTAELCATLLAFAAAVTPYDKDGVACPELKAVERAELTRMVCPGQRCGPSAAYEWGADTVYYWQRYHDGSPLLHSLIVHELVHHLQYHHDAPRERCRDLVRLEEEAYDAQRRYMHENHLGYFADALGDPPACERPEDYDL